ncbi:5'-3' exonuclease H3TH domain-containing protein [Porticoccus sp. W117]|uniref:5'-3' exonuclease n=1 Tax=Porticoccus sp. W117 TaxID=3054777 RepID=UPI0025973FF7|nr:5'-3' exonuclease H3TH domain-containing protein [Porticoccus sp. W117]MDM3872625.1 5'-3' exonuclease H3TH domain-containing protein [Porticoccus sp. W117]
MRREEFYLIDASIYIFRSYFALPDNWHSEEGWPTNAVQGYASWLLTLLEKRQPQYLAAAHDESLGSGFRHQTYPDYKANRALPDEALEFQLNACRELADLLGIAHFASSSHEADDIIGTLAEQGRNEGFSPVILSRDKDLAQLLQPGELMWDFPNNEPKGLEQLQAEFGVQLSQLADYLALTGDAIDNIPGVPGIGPKTAAAILQSFASIDDIFANTDQLSALPIRGAASLADKLAPYKEQLQITRQLTTIRCDAPLEFDTQQLQWKGIDYPAFESFCQQIGLARQLLVRAAKLL